MIKWINDNASIISLSIAFASLVLSVIALFISKHNASIPYKKKIQLKYFTNIGIGINEGIKYFSVEATNAGNKDIGISFLGIGYFEKRKLIKAYCKLFPNPSNIILEQNKIIDSRYQFGDLKQLEQRKKLYAIAIDIEGKVYKKRIKYILEV